MPKEFRVGKDLAVAIFVVIYIACLSMYSYHLLSTSIPSYTSQPLMSTVPQSIVIAVIGGDAEMRTKICGLLRELGVAKVISYETVPNNLSGIDMVILLSHVSEDEVLRILKSFVTLVTSDRVYIDDVLPVLKRIAMITASYSDTHTYAVKLLNKLPNGRYAVAIHGVASGLMNRSTLMEVISWFTESRNSANR